MFRNVVAALLVLSLAGTAAFAQTERKSLQVFRDIEKQITRYAFFTVFDDVSAALDNGTVTLTGHVTQPFKRAAIEKRVAEVNGVREIRNGIEVLPVSPFDDELRYRIARAIYGNSTFWHYAAMPSPPIHIVVDRGHVTLTGVVDNQIEKALARSLAWTFGTSSVTNELRTNAEARAELEQLN